MHGETAGLAAAETVGPLGNPIAVVVLVLPTSIDLELSSDTDRAGLIALRRPLGAISYAQRFELGLGLIAIQLCGAESRPLAPQFRVAKELLDALAATLDADLPPGDRLAVSREQVDSRNIPPWVFASHDDAPRSGGLFCRKRFPSQGICCVAEDAAAKPEQSCGILEQLRPQPAVRF